MAKLSRKKLMVKFFELVESEWGALISSMCTDEARFQSDPMLDYDDLKQEVMIYLMKYTFKVVEQRSKDGEVWTPYMKRSVHNLFVNIRKSRKNWRKRLELSGLDVRDIVSECGITNSVEDEYLYNEYVDQVMNMLNEVEKNVFFQLLRPTPEFKRYLKRVRKGNKELCPSKRQVADFFGLKYSSVLRFYKKIDRAVQLCANPL